MFDILKFLDDAPIRLVHGVGSPDTGGCWMAALSVYSGASWGDHPPCVCRMIRTLCVALNDMLSSDEVRGRVLSGVLLEPVGTATDDAKVIEARRWIAADAAVRKFAPFALRSAGLESEAQKLEALPPVTRETARAAARAAAQAANAANAAANAAADAAADAADAAADAAYAANAAYAAAYAANAAASAVANAAKDQMTWHRMEFLAAYAANAAANAAKDQFAEHVVLPVILEMCAVGSRAPVEADCTEVAFRRAVQCV